MRPQQPVQDSIEQRLGIGRDPMQASGFQETLELLAVLAGRSPFGWRTARIVAVLVYDGSRYDIAVRSSLPRVFRQQPVGANRRTTHRHLVDANPYFAARIRGMIEGDG